MGHRIAFVIALVLATLVALPSGAWAAGPQFLRPETEGAELRSSKIYVLQGEPAVGGCRFTYPELVLPPDATAIEQRDIGIDMTACVKLVEEGIPIEPLDSDAPESEATLAEEPDAGTQRWKKGYNQVWWEDVAGGMVTSAETHGKWYYNGTCSVGGNGGFGYVGYAPTGWQPVPNADGYTQNNTCTRFLAKGWATVINDVFCADRVTIKYDYVQFVGSRTGVMSGGHYSTLQGSCLPLFKHNRLVLLSQGTGGPL